MSLRRGAVRGGIARAAGAGARLQLLDVPDDGLPARHGAARAISSCVTGRDALDQLPLRHRRGRASVLPQLRGEELLPAALPSRCVERQRQLPRRAGRADRSSSSTARTGSSAKARSRRARTSARLRQRVMHRPLRLTIDRSALQSNWRWLAGPRGRARGRGDQGRRLWPRRARDDGRAASRRAAATSSCRPGPKPRSSATFPTMPSLVVLHGVGPDDVEAALTSLGAAGASTRVEQVARWKEIAPGRPCDVMIDTGMNRLGLRPDEIGALDGLDDRHAAQPSRLRRRGPCAERDAAASASARSPRRSRPSATASPIRAGICLGRDYSFDLVRPGLALYGGVPRARGRGQHPPGRAGRSADRPAAHDPRRRKLRLWRDLHRRRGHRGRDPQHRLCRRLSARLLVAAARPSPANLRCRCSAGCRWI